MTTLDDDVAALDPAMVKGDVAMPDRVVEHDDGPVVAAGTLLGASIGRSRVADVRALVEEQTWLRGVPAGAWDAMGEEGKQAYFEHFRTHYPARRIGTSQDIADAVLFAMTNPFLTGVTLRVDGGEPLT
ncbi:hypothetical protein ABH920_008522 [Catenulispora sp. EB89]|uniref:hypothetical protein n=1 Tax=Catenulispora sp. EB89 TaxID=3156257 RepID=UPI0035116820